MPNLRVPARAQAALAIPFVAWSLVACGQDETPVASPAVSGSASPPVATPEHPAVPTTTTNQPTERPMPSTPPADFYAVPDPLPHGDPGEIIWVEQVAAPNGARAWRVLYHSQSVGGTDIAVSGLVVAPAGEPPPGGFPVLAYAHGTTGLADACALSRETRPITSGGDPVGSVPLPPLWEAGYVVAATDYEGLGTPGRHPYLVGESEGRGVLDIVRAVRAIEPARAGSPTVVVGISQGGHAALFTGEIAPTYAPDVDLAGVVALAPAAELPSAAMLLTGDESVVGFAVAIGAGLAAAHPEARLEDVLTPAALEKLDVVDTGCIDDILAAYAGPFQDVIRFEAMIGPPWATLLEENTPGRTRTIAPIFVGQGDADALVVPELTDALVERLCAAGNDVTYRRYIDASHSSVIEASRDDVNAWIADRIAGAPTSAADCPD